MEPIKSAPYTSFQSLLKVDEKEKITTTLSLARTTKTSAYIFVSSEEKDCIGLIVDQDQEDKMTLYQIADQISAMLKAEAFMIWRSYFLEEISLNKPISHYKDSQPLYYKVGPAYDLEIQLDDIICNEKTKLPLRVHQELQIENLYKMIGEKISKSSGSFLLERRQLPPSLQTADDKVLPRQLDPEKTITIKLISFFEAPKEFKIEKTNTIEYLKRLIEPEYQMPRVDQSLTHNSTKLEDTNSFESYNIKDGDSIRLTGPCVSKTSLGLIPKLKICSINKLLNTQDQLIVVDKETMRKRLAKEINLKVMTLTGKTIDIAANTSESVLDIKGKIYDKEGIPIDQQHLMFCGLNLCNSGHLFEYNIGNEPTFHLVTRLRPLIDPLLYWKPTFAGYLTKKDTNSPKFAETGPAWKAVNQGLCLEGICNNKECPAYNDMVIINHNFGSVDIISASQTAKCPICSTTVESPAIAVNNCHYTLSGIKEAETGDKERFNRKWELTATSYIKIDPIDLMKEFTSLQKGKWRTLTIHAANLLLETGGSCASCPLCQTLTDTESKKTECGCLYHEECLKIIMEKSNIVCLLCHIG